MIEEKVKSIVETFYPVPELQKFEGDEYTHSLYPTEKAYNKYVDSVNKMRMKNYESEMHKYNVFAFNIGVINSLKCAELREFFLATLVHCVEDMKARHKVISENIEQYTNEINKWSYPIKLSNGCAVNLARGYIEYSRLSMVGDNGKYILNPKYADSYLGQNLALALPSEEELSEYLYVAHALDHNNRIFRSLPNLRKVLTDTVAELAKDVNKIRAVLGGEPDSLTLEHGATWGIDGQFNGIVCSEGRRASFKSFFAGGHTIQRLHVRFRITMLKD